MTDRFLTDVFAGMAGTAQQFKDFTLKSHAGGDYRPLSWCVCRENQDFVIFRTD